MEDAIDRSWSIDDNDICVKVSDTTVTLSGTVPSWYQKNEAVNIYNKEVFRLKSSALKYGFKIIPYDKIGFQQDVYPRNEVKINIK